GRSAAGRPEGPSHHRRRSRDRPRISCHRDCLFSRALPIILPARSAADAARRLGGIAAGRGGNPAPAWRRRTADGAGSVPARLGVLVLGAARESYLVSQRGLLPLAAPAAVV